MFARFIPWKFLLRRFARHHGFIDPLAVLTRFNRFSKPAALVAPTELIRAGAQMHARGLINSQAIQHNLDWVWPYWVTRQFTPTDPSFIPRAFAVTHINITHRNWTAVGVPDNEETMIVDPRGMVTPHRDGWSLDAWLVDDSGASLVPSRTRAAAQELLLDPRPRVRTLTGDADLSLQTEATAVASEQGPVGMLLVEAQSVRDAWLAVSLRPCNTEGVSFVDRIAWTDGASRWRVNGRETVWFNQHPDKHLLCSYDDGDVFFRRDRDGNGGDTVTCPVGMATAAALFRVPAGTTRNVQVSIPLRATDTMPRLPEAPLSVAAPRWEQALHGTCRIDVPDPRVCRLFDSALRTLVLHSPDDILAGPATYKRFWFRDAVLIANAMLAVGLEERAQRAMDRFLDRQTLGGYFESQEGEWDSNGQVLWLAGALLPRREDGGGQRWRRALLRAVQWIVRSRRQSTDPDHAGLMPAGFSAEHLGPNDFYYWDDAWTIAGLGAAARLFADWGLQSRAEECLHEAGALTAAVESSLERVATRLERAVLPASPTRRLDSAAVGSLAFSYPLRLCETGDTRVQATMEFLLEHCVVQGGLYHDVSHSGINPYLTLHLAQSLLRAGDMRYWGLVQSIAELASPTGQWPEAVHPQLGTGCMGDGQHVWAAAEWLMMVRNLFVREEGRELILCSGIPDRWFEHGTTMTLGPTETTWGPLSVSVRTEGGRRHVSWDASWRHRAPARIVVRMTAGFSQDTIVDTSPEKGEVTL